MEKHRILNRNMLAARKVTREVPLDDDGCVMIQSLPASVLVAAAENPEALKPGSLLVKSLIDENGKRLFDDGEEQAALECFDSMAMQKVLKAVNELNNFTGEAEGQTEKN